MSKNLFDAFQDILNDIEDYLIGGRRREHPRFSIEPPQRPSFSETRNIANVRRYGSEHRDADFSGTGISRSKTADDDNGEVSVIHCKRCTLSGQSCKAPVPGKGSDAPVVLVIVDPPDLEADNRGLPLGKSEMEYLEKWMEALSLKGKFYVTNFVKCRPPGSRTPFPEEVEACSFHLTREIQRLSPSALLLLGGGAARAVSQKRLSLPQLREESLEGHGKRAIATYTPQEVLKNEKELKRIVWEDLKRLRELFPAGQ